MPIKSLIPPGPFINEPVFDGGSSNDFHGSTETHDIRPPVGQLWNLDYCWIEGTGFSSPDPGKGMFFRIMITKNGGTSFVEMKGTQILQGSSITVGGTRIDLGGSGTTFLLSNQKFIRLSMQGNSTAGTFTADWGAIARIL